MGGDDGHGSVNNNGTTALLADGMTVEAQTPALTVKGNGSSSHAEVRLCVHIACLGMPTPSWSYQSSYNANTSRAYVQPMQHFTAVHKNIALVRILVLLFSGYE